MTSTGSAVAEVTTEVVIAGDLVVAIGRFGRSLKARLGERGDAGPIFYLLHLVGSAGPLRMTELAALAGLDHSTISRHVTNLIEDGKVSRQPDPTDRRAWRLELTDAGRQVVGEALERRAKVIAKAMEGWAADDQRTLLRLFNELIREMVDE